MKRLPDEQPPYMKRLPDEQPPYWRLEGHMPVPATIDEIVDLFDPSSDFRRVARDTVGDAEISTVFLVFDHSWGSGPLMLFETMVFGGPHNGSQWRYSTWEEAELGHHRITEALRGGRDPEDEP